MKTLDRIFAGLIIVTLSILAIGMILLAVAGMLKPFLTEDSDFIIIETECYDKHDNEIQDVVCEKEVYCGGNSFYGFFFKSEDCQNG